MSAVALLRPDRERIIGCLNLFQKPGTAGERDAAAAALNRLLEARGLGWEEIIVTSATEQRHHDEPLYGWRGDLAACQRAAHKLTEWEKNFVSSIAMQRSLSPKQQTVLARLVQKVRAA